MGFLDNDLDSRRTLSVRDKQILYLRANKRCENPACNKKIDFIDMEVGHKNKAHSKGGRTTLGNSVCLCHGCNKRQGTDSWATFLKKQGVVDPKTKMKESLEGLSITQLKSLAQKHQVKVTGKIIEDWFDSHRKAPTKKQYINKLAGIVTDKELGSLPKPQPIKRKKRRKSDSLW